jgi:phage anti-repressor protein
MCEYGFTEGRDFNPIKNERVQLEGGREVKREITDYRLTLSMAKEVAMIQRTDQGRRIRQHLIKSAVLGFIFLSYPLVIPAKPYCNSLYYNDL